MPCGPRAGSCVVTPSSGTCAPRRRRSSGRAATRRRPKPSGPRCVARAGLRAAASADVPRVARTAARPRRTPRSSSSSSSSSRPRSSAAWSAATARAGTGARAGRGFRRRAAQRRQHAVRDVRRHENRRAAVAAAVHGGARRVPRRAAHRKGAGLRRRGQGVRVRRVTRGRGTTVDLRDAFYVFYFRIRAPRPSSCVCR